MTPRALVEKKHKRRKRGDRPEVQRNVPEFEGGGSGKDKLPVLGHHF